MGGIDFVDGLGKDIKKDKPEMVEKSLTGFKEIPNESKKNVRELSQFVDNYLAETRAKYGKESAIKDKLDHVDRVVKLVEKMAPDNELAVLAAKCHDLGRIPQYEILGKFDDGKVLHHNLGEDLIGRWMFQGKVKTTEELAAVRQVVMFHGRTKFMPFTPYMPEYVKNVVDVVSRADGIENGCIGFMEYGEREAVTDAKSYKANNPDLDMKTVSPEVVDFFLKGEKFDKMKYCKTYAEYTLFAAVLAVQGLKGEDREIAKAAMEMPCTGYNNKQYANALEGYKDLFTRFIDPKVVGQCHDRLVQFYKEGK